MQLDNGFKKYVNESISNLIVSLNKYKLTCFYRKIDLKFLYGYEKYINFGVMKHIYNRLSSLPESNNSICSIILVSNKNNYEIYMCNEKNDLDFFIEKNMKILKRSDKSMPINKNIKSREKFNKFKKNEHEVELENNRNISIKIHRKLDKTIKKSKNYEHNLYKKILNLPKDDQDRIINKILNNETEKSTINDNLKNNSISINNTTEQTSNEPVSIINEDTFIIDRTSNNTVSNDVVGNDSGTINLNILNDDNISRKTKRKKIYESIELNENLKVLPNSKRIRTSVKRYSDEFC